MLIANKSSLHNELDDPRVSGLMVLRTICIGEEAYSRNKADLEMKPTALQ